MTIIPVLTNKDEPKVHEHEVFDVFYDFEVFEDFVVFADIDVFKDFEVSREFEDITNLFFNQTISRF